MKRSRLLKLWKSYLWDKKVKGVDNWDKYMPVFASEIPDEERRAIYSQHAEAIEQALMSKYCSKQKVQQLA